MTEGRRTRGACRRAGKSPPRDAAGLTGAPHGFCTGRGGGLGGRLGTTSKLRKSTGAWRWPCQGAGGATYTGLGGGGGGFGGRLSPRGGRAGGARMPRRQFWSLSAVDIAAAYIAFAGVRRRFVTGRALGFCAACQPLLILLLICHVQHVRIVRYKHSKTYERWRAALASLQRRRGWLASVLSR